MISQLYGFLAEIPTDAIVWIIIGIVWAIAQIFGKLARRAKDSQSETRQTRPREAPPRHRAVRPTSPHEPVSPNDELRRFLREISGEAEPDVVPQPAPRRPATPAPRKPQANMKSNISQPEKPATATRPTAQKPPARGTAHPSPKPKITVKRAPTGKPASVPGLGNWRTAVLHREIIGPPRAVRPYGSPEF